MILKLLAILSICLSFTEARDIPDYGWEVTTDLDEYVHRDDGAFEWEILTMYEYSQVDIYIVNMTSQIWMAHDEDFCDKQLWYHLMGIAVPHEITKPNVACLFIDAGSNSPDSLPSYDNLSNRLAASFANDSGAIVAYQLQVPNQPITFRDDPLQRRRREDDVIAYTWRWFIDRFYEGEEPTPEVAIRMPMTKAAKRGLDTIQGVAQEVAGVDITEFAVAGASKRGWTTWSLAATDQRVKYAVPLVMSLLHFEEVLQSHFMSMDNAWSFAFKPYWRENLTVHLTEEVSEQYLFDYEDPYRFRSRLSMIPRLCFSATGDEFFLLQDHHSWWDDMGGHKWLLQLANAEHAMAPHYLKIYRTTMGWFNTVTDPELGPEALPQISWTRSWEEGSEEGSITYESSQPPLEVRGMRAVTLRNSTRRDFRLARGDYDDFYPQPVIWRERPVQNLSSQGENVFEMTMDTVEDEWVGFLVEGVYESEDGYEMTFSSEAHVIPDTFPGENCQGDECFGTLV